MSDEDMIEAQRQCHIDSLDTAADIDQHHAMFHPFREWREYFDHRFNHLIHLLETRMSNLDTALSDLAAAVQKASDDQVASSTAVQAELTALGVAIGSGSTAADGAAKSIETIVATMQANSAKQEADTAALVASVAPAPAPAPAPAAPVAAPTSASAVDPTLIP